MNDTNWTDVLLPTGDQTYNQAGETYNQTGKTYNGTVTVNNSPAVWTDAF